MKKIWGLGSLLVACSVGFVQVACSSSSTEPEAPTGVVPKVDDLIGSVSVNSASLDGIGTIGVLYEYDAGVGGFGSAGAGGAFLFPEAGGAFSVGGSPPIAGSGSAIAGGFSAGAPGVAGSGGGYASFYPNCTGTLISKNSVLTSRNCAASFAWPGYGGTLAFGIGANGYSPSRIVKVVDVEYAPPSEPGVDLAVLHLAESITGVAPFPVAVLGDDQVGTVFAGVGYGNSDLNYQSGARRAGAITLRANTGSLYPLIFSDFEAFYGFYTGGFPSGGVGGAGTGTSLPFPDPGIAGTPPSAGAPSQAGGPSAGAGGGGDDWYRQYLLQQYNTVALAPGESYAGGGDADAQPCGIDAGGPLVRKAQGKVRVFGVFSRTPFGGCDKGGVYSRITASTKAFVDAAAQWVDPCNNVTAAGKCSGNTAVRCSSVSEGKRRVVKFDCSLLNQICVSNGVTEVACTDK